MIISTDGAERPGMTLRAVHVTEGLFRIQAATATATVLFLARGGRTCSCCRVHSVTTDARTIDCTWQELVRVGGDAPIALLEGEALQRRAAVRGAVGSLRTADADRRIISGGAVVAPQAAIADRRPFQ